MPEQHLQRWLEAEPSLYWDLNSHCSCRLTRLPSYVSRYFHARFSVPSFVPFSRSNTWNHKDKGRPRGRLHSDAQVNLRARKHQTLYVTLGNLRDSAWQDVNSVPMWCLSESALAAQTCFDQRSGFNVTYASLFTLNIRKRARLIIVPSFSEMSLIASSSSSSPLAFSLRIPEPSSYLIKVMWFK